MNRFDLPIGIENYKEAVKKYYVDKTLFIRDLVERGEGKAILLTRPRRFGKSLALSTVDYFFNIKEDSRPLFADKRISECGEDIVGKMNQFPVVHLSMKGIEFNSSSSILDRAKDRICMLYRMYPELLDSQRLSEVDRREFAAIYTKQADEVLYISSLERLTRFLYLHYQRKVVLLVDEYDAPVESSYENGCYKEVMGFFKPFYGDALKGNDALYFALVSGVLQISKESLFSGLNNLVVSSIASPFLSRYFGFDKEEVTKILSDYGIPLDYETVASYYGGYRLPNGDEVCNPWSILNFVEERKLKPYWVNTGTNSLLSKAIRLERAGSSLLDFLNNAAKKAPFHPAISYSDMGENAGMSLSFLAQTGYLTILSDQNDFREDLYEYKIPNREIYEAFRLEIIGRNVVNESMSAALRLKEALLQRKDNEISSIINEYLLISLSCFDLQDERNYHNAITGLLSVLFDGYIVKNEIQTGLGRCDIIMIPKDPSQIGIVIEIKKSRARGQISKARLNELATQAVKQIKAKNYLELLTKAGCKTIFLYGFAFQNKTSAIVSEGFSKED